MRLATLNDGTPDGRLVLVSHDAASCAKTPAKTLQEALENWDAVAPLLHSIADFPDALDMTQLRAPLPRAWQWLDGSVYSSHARLMEKMLGIDPVVGDGPLMYQGVSSKFFGPFEDVVMADEELGIDFEGEFGIITDFVPMGTSVAAAAAHIKLVVQVNDWSLRALAGPEMKTGFGWLQAKPPCSMAPFAVTPDELGSAWSETRPGLDLRVEWNGALFGDANGGPMDFGFDELIAHAARTRDLVAGTVIGSGTVSNADFREVGSSCIAERRGIEVVDEGEARTGFMKFGDRVRMEAHLPDGHAPFGAIDQRVVRHRLIGAG